MSVSAIIVAAGSGKRVGGDLPKQFQTVRGKPILYYTLRKFEQCTQVDEVVVVAAQDWLTSVSQEVIDRFEFEKVRLVVAGGKQRQDSVYAGLKALAGPPELVAIHDAVRPFVSVEKIAAVIHAGREHGAAILAVPPKDTIKIEKDGFVDETPDRHLLWSVQTPQVFRYDLILAAYEQAYKDGVYKTDDSALVEKLGQAVKIVEGEPENIKITVPPDLQLAELLLSENR